MNNLIYIGANASTYDAKLLNVENEKDVKEIVIKCSD